MGKGRWGTSSPNIGGEKKRGMWEEREGGIRFRIRLGVRVRERLGLGLGLHARPFIQAPSNPFGLRRLELGLGLS